MRNSFLTSHVHNGTAVLAERTSHSLSVAFINNMPDSAFAATERQFLDLVTAGAQSESVTVSKFSLGGIQRGPEVARHIATTYDPVDALWDQSPDALIITGSEPLTAHLPDEAYWEQLTYLLQRFVGRAGSVLLSCLSAHAALEFLDGIRRVPLSEKCTGVFRQEIVPGHFLTDGLEEPLSLPHSRLNEVPTSSLERAGYDVVVASRRHGWSVASKRVAGTELVLFQGHPEYGASSLVREYRRDLERYLVGRSEALPQLPANCVSTLDEPAMMALQKRVLEGERNVDLLDHFPLEEIAIRNGSQWKHAAKRLFSNWLSRLAIRRS
jgi:homoserine O-succinyltransferase/O-acetyltransferase